jgi:hypothetical protein
LEEILKTEGTNLVQGLQAFVEACEREQVNFQ